MNINTITAEDLRRMSDKEGLILQGCGGDLTEWVDGINEMLTKAGILKDGCQFENVAAFQHGELTCLLYPFDDVKLDIGKLALWRLQTHEVYGGTWLSDFVPNYLGGFIETPETQLARIGHRLARLYQIMQENRRRVDEERQELQTLVSDISHQVKTPVSNLKMATDTLLEKPMAEAERTDFIRGIRSQTDKLDFLFQALVKTSRLETGVIQLDKKPGRLFDTVAQAMSGIVYAAEKKEIAVSVDCPEDLTVSHDSKWTSEALFNLLDNAVKYTPAGGKIAVSVVLWEMYVEIKVTDTGKGISESNQAAIFRRFYREEEVHEQQGVGIGLYLAREIITRQGGYIKVVSEPGKGSEFSIMLPTK